jgi:hypothetical protein
MRIYKLPRPALPIELALIAIGVLIGIGFTLVSIGSSLAGI